ncbi:hypothetical protein ACQEWB_40400 [Streptomyces sp. CA-249302]
MRADVHTPLPLSPLLTAGTVPTAASPVRSTPKGGIRRPPEGSD